MKPTVLDFLGKVKSGFLCVLNATEYNKCRLLLIDCRYEKADYNPSEIHTGGRVGNPVVLKWKAMKGRVVEKPFEFLFKPTRPQRKDQIKRNHKYP